MNSDPYSLSALPRSGPAPRGLDDRHEVPPRTGYADWEAGDLPLAQYVDRPEAAQEWGVLIGMWGLGLAAGLMVIGVVVQMVAGR